MNITDVNLTDISEKGKPFLEPIQKLSNFFQEKIIELGFKFPDVLSTLLTIFLGVLFIIIGTKITNKILKVILFILGVLILIGLVLSFFGKI